MPAGKSGTGASFGSREKPLPSRIFFGDAASWTGPNDGSFSFITGHDASRFVIAAHVTDERIEAGDAVEFFIDTRPDEKRRADPRMLRGTLRVKASAPDAEGRSSLEAFVNRRSLEGGTATGRCVACSHVSSRPRQPRLPSRHRPFSSVLHYTSAPMPPSPRSSALKPWHAS